MDATIKCSEQSYLIPSKDITEIVLTEDFITGGGFLYSNKGVLVLNSFAVDLIKKSFVNENSTPIKELLKSTEDVLWFQAVLKTNIFELSVYEPRKRIIDEYPVERNEVINPCSSIPPVALQFAGNVLKEKCNRTLIYYYLSTEGKDLGLNNSVQSCTSALLYNNYNTDICPREYIHQQGHVSLTPQEDFSAMGSSCTSCTQCDNCNYCLVCVWGFIALVSLVVGTSLCAGTATGCSSNKWH